MYLSFRCGVLWSEGQFTLDCRECGGFAADRPCVDCDGQCGQVWQRDVPTVSERFLDNVHPLMPPFVET